MNKNKLIVVFLVLSMIISTCIISSASTDSDDLSNYTIVNSWSNGFQVSIELSESLNWVVEFDTPNEIVSCWGAEQVTTTNSDSTNHYKFTPPSYGSTSLGFVANGDSSILPTNFTITYSSGDSEEDNNTEEILVHGFLSVDGTKLLDNGGNEVQMTGVNWFGLETSNKEPHGLWSRDYRSMLRQIKEIGFNTIRFPWSNEILEEGAMPVSISYGGADPYDGTSPMNDKLQGLTSLEILDELIDYCGKLGLRVVLDNHSREADGYMNEKLWYTDSVSEEKWIEDWATLAERYKDNPVVVGMDINNEPHGEATWGDSNSATDWNKAAERCGNAILEVNPDVLIIVEGIAEYEGDSYWWGGNLLGVRDYPIELSDPSKLMYSMHEYGPNVHLQEWFEDSTFPSNMPSIWNNFFGFIRDEGIGHLFCGEFGIQDVSDEVQYTWFTEFMKEYGSSTSWTYWCINPNSGDTGGILKYDWVTLEQEKVDIIEPYFAPMITGVEE